MFELSIRTASEMKPVALMRLSQIDDVDELLKKHDRDDISVEEKLDGWKVQVIKSGGDVRLYSRRGDEKTENFPDLIKALSSALPDGSMVEGELVYWEKNKQDVGKVTSIAGSSPENAKEKLKDLSGTLKIHLYDALWSKGKNISDKPFSERRKALQSMVKAGDTVQLTKQYPFGEWQKAMNAAVQSGGEGIVLKVKDKPYEYKSIGEKEPKPAGIMYKYKGGGGKEDSDDYVVYDYETGDKGKLKALFGQYHDGKLYHISEISNFSKEDEEKLKKKLKSGMFVIEIGFQERLPGGLRHQKFVRFRDDKKPKDATMHEFHVKNKDNFDEAKKNEVADRPYIDDTGYTFPAEDIMFSKRAMLLEDSVIQQLETLLGPKFLSKPRRIGFVGNVDGDKMFRHRLVLLRSMVHIFYLHFQECRMYNR
jgi:ATP-dependent DNA ligase